MKAQTVRLIDVFLLGPFMMVVAKELSGWKRDALFVSGLLTIVYNGQNYLRYRDGEETKRGAVSGP